MLGFPKKKLKHALKLLNRNPKGALDIIKEHISKKSKFGTAFWFLNTQISKFFDDLDSAKRAIEGGKRVNAFKKLTSAKDRIKAMERVTNELRELEAREE